MPRRSGGALRPPGFSNSGRGTRTSCVRPRLVDCLWDGDGTGNRQASRAEGMVPAAMVPRWRGRGALPGRRLHLPRGRTRDPNRRGAPPDDSPGARRAAQGFRLPRMRTRLETDDRVPDPLLPLRALRRSGPLAGRKLTGPPAPTAPGRDSSAETRRLSPGPRPSPPECRPAWAPPRRRARDRCAGAAARRRAARSVR